ncbi:MAG: membrane protein insertion efficiency factor YidD [Bdellovibrionota bacterium]
MNRKQHYSPLIQGLLFLIMFYRKCISPALGARCRFYPSCSEYSGEVLKKYGLAQGLKKSMIRLCKCQPFCKGGVDLP